MTNFTFKVYQKDLSDNGINYRFECKTQRGANYRGTVWMGYKGGVIANSFRVKDLKSISRMTKFGSELESAAIKFVKESV